MTKKPKLVIFDMDGTMLDTERISLAGLIHATKTMGYETTEGFFTEMIGRNVAFAKQLANERYGESFDFELAHNLHLEYVDEYFKNYGVPIKEGLVHLLNKLEEMGIKKCVATSTAKGRATHKLKFANLLHYFEVIVGGDEVVESKPNPEIFLKAASYCNIAPEDCLIIEDSIAGANGAFNAKIPVILVPDIGPLTDEVKNKAVAVCKNLFDVANEIELLNF